MITVLNVVVAQLVERLLPTPEIRGSNTDIDNFSYQQLYNKLFWKDENKIKKRPGIAQFKKPNFVT